MNAPPADAPRPVRRRHVFYLSGFDPQGPAHYHRLYAEEAPKQAAVDGYEIEVGPRERAGPHAARWSVEGRFDGEAVQSTIEVLRWDDIVRAHWPRSRWVVAASALASTARQVANGVLWRILKTSWPAFLVLAMPPLLVVGVLVALAAIAICTGWLVAEAPVLPALLAAAALTGGLALFARWAEQRVQMAWLMRSTRFIRRQARRGTPALDARLDDFARRVSAVVTEPGVDEVLVVGHSSGAMLAASLVARLTPPGAPVDPSEPGANQALPAAHLASVGRARVALLTLGECIPMLSYQPEADWFRDELARVAQGGWPWLDFTAPPDGCCFALVDPTAACDPVLRAASGWRAPKRLSPRFAQRFSEERYAALRRDKYRCHFQYLMAFERPGTFDYFSITAGPQGLVERFAGQPGVERFIEFQMFGGPDP